MGSVFDIEFEPGTVIQASTVMILVNKVGYDAFLLEATTSHQEVTTSYDKVAYPKHPKNGHDWRFVYWPLLGRWKLITSVNGFLEDEVELSALADITKISTRVGLLCWQSSTELKDELKDEPTQEVEDDGDAVPSPS